MIQSLPKTNINRSKTHIYWSNFYRVFEQKYDQKLSQLRLILKDKLLHTDSGNQESCLLTILKA